jgi:hypothetical protein
MTVIVTFKLDEDDYDTITDKVISIDGYDLEIVDEPESEKDKFNMLKRQKKYT